MMMPVERTSADTRAWTLNWQSVYEIHAEELLRCLVKLLRDREKASELLQETFVHAIRHEQQIHDPAAVRAWLFRIATNLALSERRRAGLIRFVTISLLDTHEAEAGLASDKTEVVRAALRALPFEQAAALVLHYHAGLSRAEIAEVRGVSEEAVKSRLARGRRNFIERYQRFERGTG